MTLGTEQTEQLIEKILDHLETGEELHLEIDARGRTMILSLKTTESTDNELLSRWEAAAMLGVTVPILRRLMEANLVYYETVARTHVFRRGHIAKVKAMITDAVEKGI